MKDFEIITFYDFREMPSGDALVELRNHLRSLMRELEIKGTIILASEGFNSTVCGPCSNVERFVAAAGDILGTRLNYKSSFHEHMPFRRVDVKIKPEVVTLKREVDIENGEGTHVEPRDWNDIISDPGTFRIGAPYDYEIRSGKFRRAINPAKAKFSDLPRFVSENLDPARHKRVAMFCTGGIRCEKFAPYMKQLGFEEVYQLRGGILKYFEDVSRNESLWEGECFVFDDRVTV